MLRFLAVLISIFFLSINISFGDDKIVFLDMEMVLKKSIFGKNLLSEIDNLNKKNIDELKIKEIELKNKEAEIKKKQNILSKEEIDKEIDNLKNQVKIYRKEKEEMVKKLELKRKNNLNIFLTETSPIIQNYMEENSIDILLDRKNVFMGKKNSDITEIIIKAIDKKLKKWVLN